MTRSQEAENIKRKQRAMIIGFVVGIGLVTAFIVVVMTPPAAAPPSGSTGEGGVIIEAHGQRVAYHHHVSLWYYEDGDRKITPNDIGRGENYDPDHPLAQYGPKGLMPLHTHDYNGLVHIEPTTDIDFTFGDFLDIWGINLEGKQVELYKLTITYEREPIPDYRGYVLQDEDRLQLEVKNSLGN